MLMAKRVAPIAPYNQQFLLGLTAPRGRTRSVCISLLISSYDWCQLFRLNSLDAVHSRRV